MLEIAIVLYDIIEDACVVRLQIAVFKTAGCDNVFKSIL